MNKERELRIKLGLAEEIETDHDVQVEINIRILPIKPYYENAATKEIYRQQLESRLNFRAYSIASRLKETILKMLTDE